MPYLWPNWVKNHTLWGHTYLCSPYKRVPPPRDMLCHAVLNCIVQHLRSNFTIPGHSTTVLITISFNFQAVLFLKRTIRQRKSHCLDCVLYKPCNCDDMLQLMYFDVHQFNQVSSMMNWRHVPRLYTICVNIWVSIMITLNWQSCTGKYCLFFHLVTSPRKTST